MPRKYQYRRVLPHLQKDFRPIFATFVTQQRWELPESARQVVLDCCVRQHGQRMDLHAAVVMPDHVHLIFSALRDVNGESFTIYEIMHAVKGAAAHATNKALSRSGPVWQEEYFDHVLRSNEDIEEKVEYLLENPVRKGLVKTAEEYPWSWRGTLPRI